MSQKDLDKLYELVSQYKEVYKDQLKQQQKYDQKYEMLPYMDKPLKDSQKSVIKSYLNNEIDKNKLVQDPNKKVPNRYMRQQRLQIDYNYNYEQHRSYTKLYRRQKKKDQQKWIEQKKMYKYLFLNKDVSVDAKRIIQKECIDFNSLPMEQIMKQDVSDFKIQAKGSKRAKLRKYIKTKSLKDITNYTAWRNLDRSIFNIPLQYKRVNPCCKITFPPKLIKQVFGSPQHSSGQDKNVSTALSFQDQNFDIFLLYEYRQTTFYHGQNRQDEYYDYLRRLKGPGTRMRKIKWPSVEEFWECDEPKQFRVTASQYADFRKFKMWFKTEIKKYKQSRELYE